MLAFGQHYSGMVTEVYDAQIGANGGPTVDLTYGNNNEVARHVQYDPDAQQPNTYCVSGDKGWVGTVEKALTIPKEDDGRLPRGAHANRDLTPDAGFPDQPFVAPPMSASAAQRAAAVDPELVTPEFIAARDEQFAQRREDAKVLDATAPGWGLAAPVDSERARVQREQAGSGLRLSSFGDDDGQTPARIDRDQLKADPNAGGVVPADTMIADADASPSNAAWPGQTSQFAGERSASSPAAQPARPGDVTVSASQQKRERDLGKQKPNPE
jgi:hypothetical protein